MMDGIERGDARVRQREGCCVRGLGLLPGLPDLLRYRIGLKSILYSHPAD